MINLSNKHFTKIFRRIQKVFVNIYSYKHLNQMIQNYKMLKIKRNRISTTSNSKTIEYQRFYELLYINKNVYLVSIIFKKKIYVNNYID